MTVCKGVANTGKGATMKGRGGGASGAGNEAFEVKGDSMMDVGGKGKRGVKGKVISSPCLGGMMGGGVGVVLLAPSKIGTVEEGTGGSRGTRIASKGRLREIGG